MDPRMATKRPPASLFRQQRLAAWQPLLTPNWVIGTFILFGVIFIPLGCGILVTSNQVIEVNSRYDTCSSDLCFVSLQITKDMKPPLFFYYKLTNYYQNHRRYVKSRSDEQLRGIDVLSNLGSCDPLSSLDGSPLYPCGLIANSFFNDTFQATYCPKDGNCTQLEDPDWSESDIAWSSDKSEKFKLADPPVDTSVGPGGFQLPNVTNEHFIVWMRTAGLPTFKKLYARLPNLHLYAGDMLNVTIKNVYPVAPFNGQKIIVLSTTSWLGGKNEFLGYAYIIVGAICLVIGAFFWLRHCYAPRNLGDMRYFNWPAFNPLAKKSPTTPGVVNEQEE